jgi:hypothetical protein
MAKLISTLVASTLLCTAVSLPSHAQIAGGGSTKTIGPITCYQCVKPETAQCLVQGEEQESTCPECTQWIAVAFDSGHYSYNTGPPRANYFVSDASNKLFGNPLPSNSAGHPISMQALYSNPGKYGWIELKPNAPKIGSIAVLPSVGGVVVDGAKNQSGPCAGGAVCVLYPSNKKDGNLAYGDIKDLTGADRPKFLVPAKSSQAP